MGNRRADMFIEPGADPRTEPPVRGDERDTLVGFLRWQRETLEQKCSGLSDGELARCAVEPSTLSLLGLLRHMADVERGWFRVTMAGQDAPAHYWSEPDGEFAGAIADPEVVAQAWATWRKEVALAERFVDETPDLGTVAKVSGDSRGPKSLRWVLTHLIEEYARHNGHADLLRERIDGRVGQ